MIVSGTILKSSLDISIIARIFLFKTYSESKKLAALTKKDVRYSSVVFAISS